MKPKLFEEIELFRMTHIDNIGHILNFGITRKYSSNKNHNYKDIGDKSLISARNNISVKINNNTINLGDFIPFYFGTRMPMLYVIQNGGNFVPKPTPAQDVIYIICKLQLILNLNFDF